MKKSANDAMQLIVYGAVVDAIVALKESANGMPNILMRDINAISPNATFADLPKSVQQAIRVSTKDAFNKLIKEGYEIGPRGETRPKAMRGPPKKNTREA